MSTVVLTLDTTAPTVSFGEPTGTTGGELFHIPYTSDEPIAAATLRLRDRRTLTMNVLADALEVLLPADTPEGQATVAAADDVGNAATTIVLLQGVPFVEPVQVQTTPGVPGLRTTRRRRTRGATLRSRSRAHAGARARTTSDHAELATAVPSSTADVFTSSRRSSSAAGIATVRILAAGAHATSAQTVTRGTVERRDGPDTEAALLELL